MANLTSVGITSGVPSSGTGTVSTIDQLLAQGSPISNGSTTSLAAYVLQPSSVVTSTMPALNVQVSSLSPPRLVNLSSNPTVIPSSAIQVTLTSNVVALSSNPTITAVSSGLILTRGAYGAAQLTQASVSVASSGNNILVTRAVGTIKVYGLYAIPDSGLTIQFCNGSTALVLSGPMSINSITLPVQTEPYFTTTGTNNFVANLSTSVQLSGMIYYLDN